MFDWNSKEMQESHENGKKSITAKKFWNRKVFKILTKSNIMARLIEIQKKCKIAMRTRRNQLWLKISEIEKFSKYWQSQI